MQSNSVMTLSNSIIGVSILAMPFCFQQCGIILSLVILFFTSIISRLACHFLMKSAVISRCRSFEFLAFHIFGPAGKTVIELSIVGFLLGSCVAFFVVVGDLGPAIVKSVLNLELSVQALRPALLIGVAVFIVLPLGLLRDIDSLSSICTISIGFYVILVLKIIFEATPPIFASTWTDKVNFWRPTGLLQCLPIFSSALSCQTQLFEIFGSHLNGPLDKINSAVKSSVNMCTAVYMGVGLFGYIAFCSQPLTGNALMNFPPSISGDIIKLGFVCSVALSFPLVIFPCRASLNSFLYHQNHSPHYELLVRDVSGSSQSVLTLIIVTISLILALLVPSIELVLGLLGSTIGVILCYILPSVFFTRLLKKNTNERLLAQLVIVVGIFIMVLGTYVNLFATEEALSGQDNNAHEGPLQKFAAPEKDFLPDMKLSIEEPKKQIDELFQKEPQKIIAHESQAEENLQKETRKEPLVPVEPSDPKKINVDTKKLNALSNEGKNPEVNLPEDSKNLKEKEEVKAPVEVKVEKLPEKSVEKQVESPNENVAAPKVDANQEILIPKARKIMKPKRLGEVSKLRSTTAAPKMVINPQNLEGKRKLEIMDRLKDTVPLPIALQKNLNVFNISADENTKVKKDLNSISKNDHLIDVNKNKDVHDINKSENLNDVSKNNVDKNINRDLLGQKTRNDIVDRERRDLSAITEQSSDDTKIEDAKTNKKNEDVEDFKMTIRTIEVVKKLEILEPESKIVISDSRDVGNDRNFSLSHNEGKEEMTEKDGGNSVVLVDEVISILVDESVAQDRVIGDKTASSLEKDSTKAALAHKNIGAELDLKSSVVSKNELSDFINLEMEDTKEPFGMKASQKDQSPTSNRLDSKALKVETLKEVLKNSNPARVEKEETCIKNQTTKEKSAINETVSKSELVASNKADPKLSATNGLTIQAAGRLSSPDNVLESLKVYAGDLRDAFPDVAKPLKRDLKSLNTNVGLHSDGEVVPVDTNNYVKKNLGSLSSKTIELEDGR